MAAPRWMRVSQLALSCGEVIATQSWHIDCFGHVPAPGQVRLGAYATFPWVGTQQRVPGGLATQSG
jgi:hypothetical protein